MRVNVEGHPLETEPSEVVVDDNISLHAVGTRVAFEADYLELDIHEVSRLIKGLELAKKLFLEVEEEKE